ncbi:pilus assembly protein TadG-related protein [Streptomyces sp. NPDC047974]|uniref:pilus assembly protein TadG-related protein n=1 Tax=Streptomyces sp. NPDC047974 TaxID=3154343 RepID=UPI00340CD41D
MAGLLLLGFVYFVVGRAAVVRNGAQTAADAAALAAAHDAREQLREGWLGVIDDPGRWLEFIDGDAIRPAEACRAARAFAARNDAEIEDCSAMRLGFRVTVLSKDTVGESIVPDTGTQRAVATATAVIEPRCSFDAPVPTEEPQTPPTPPAEPEEEPELILGLACDGEPVAIDPEDPVLPDVGDLFYVRLTGDDE